MCDESVCLCIATEQPVKYCTLILHSTISVHFDRISLKLFMSSRPKLVRELVAQRRETEARDRLHLPGITCVYIAQCSLFSQKKTDLGTHIRQNHAAVAWEI